MRYQPLGDSGLHVSAVGLGCNNFGGRLDGEATRAVVDAALDVGITLLDTADVYGGEPGGSESALGEALSGRRDQVVLATKFGHQGYDVGFGPSAGGKGGRTYIRRAIEMSLQRLKTDHVDLYQLHTPDPLTPIEETLSALHELVAEGKVRYLGSSNFAAWQVAEADHVAAEIGATRFVSAQNLWSLLERGAEQELLPAAERYGVGLLPYSPLANGLLTGKVKRGEGPAEGTRLASERAQGYVTDAKLDSVEAMTAWAAERGHSLLEVAVSGLLAHPATGSVIAGATSADQVRANAAAGDWVLSQEEVVELQSL
jgi:aryl-alcohol dehydrogenase-like predicted oxidoreductase